jgi:hypothetical protein
VSVYDRPRGRYRRDRFIVVEALAFAVEALSGLPIELRPDNNIADMKRLIAEYVKSDAGLGQVQQIAHIFVKTV